METINLVKKARAGDKEALLALIMLPKQDYYRLAYTYMNNDEDAMDAMEDMIVIIYENIDRIKKPEAFYSWSKTILVNCCRKLLRKKKKILSWEATGEESREVFSKLDQQMALESIPSYLNKKMGEKDLSTAQLFEAASTERSTGYKIMNGQLLPSRDSLLRVSFALELDVNETQYLLKIGRRARLTPRDSRDAVILHCIIKHISLVETNITLFEAGEEPL